jgi:hypothetical protein
VVPAINGEAQREVNPAGFETDNAGSVCENRNNAKPEDTTRLRHTTPNIERVESFFILIFIL